MLYIILINEKKMKNSRKILRTIILFMLLIPFRLPVSILIIDVFNYIAQINSSEIPREVLSSNIIVTKLIYDLILGGYFIYGIEILSRSIMKRSPISSSLSYEEPKDPDNSLIFWWTGVIIVFNFIYIIFDVYSTSELVKYISL